jgi:hypothetical protein
MTPRQKIDHAISQWRRFKNAYFWTPEQSASGRRNYEKKNSMSIETTYKKHKIIVSIDVDCSCKNICVTKRLWIDGEQKTLTALNTLLKRKKRAKKSKRRIK